MALAKTNLPPEEQIRNIADYDDQVAAGSSMETTSGSLENNIQAVISQVNRALNGTVTGNNWFVDPPAPTTFEGGAVRGTIDNNQDLHDLERKRVLKRRSMVGLDITIASAGDQYVILGAADLPTETTAAIGAVTSLGTVVATAGTFGTAGLDEVAGSNALQPKNLMILTDNATGDVVTRTSDGRQIFGLFQSESSTDGSTITATSPDRVQISFVVHNSANDDLELISSGDMDGITFDYAYVERHALQDLPEEAFLGEGFADTGVSAATRQAVYDNQGASVVTTTTNATLDVGTGFTWEIGDANSDALMTFTEGSTGGTTTLAVGVATDVYNNNAVDVNFDNGVTVDNGSNAINFGVTADQIDFTGNATVTSSTGSTVTVTADSANATLSTTSSGNVVVSAAGAFDADGTSVTIDASTAGVSIDGVTSSNLTMTAATATTETLTIEATNSGAGTGVIDVNADDDVTVDSANAGISLDAATASNFNVTAGNLAFGTGTSGSVLVDGTDGVEINSTGGALNIGNDADANAINVGTGAAARTITVGNATGATAVDLDSGTGAVSVSTTNADTSELMSWSQSGTGGATVSVIVGDTSPDGRVTAAVGSLFVDGAGPALWQNDDGSTSWVQFDAAGATSLSSAVATQGGTAFTAGTFNTQWGLTDGQFIEFGDSGNVGILTVSAAAAGDSVTVDLAETAGGATFDVTDGTNSLFTVTSVTGGDTLAMANLLTVDVDTTGAITMDSSGGGISLAGSAASDFTVTGADLTLASTTSGSVLVDGEDGVEINSASGALQLGNDADTGAINVGTGAAARTITVGNSTGATGVVVDVGTGEFALNSTVGEVDPVATLTATGTNGESVELFCGSSDPDGSVTGLAGSLFFADDGVTGRLYLNTSAGSGTTWSELQAGAASTLADVVADVGTSPALQSDSFTWEVTDGDNLTWESETGNHTLVSVAPAAGGDQVTIGDTGDAASDLNVNTAASTFNAGAAFDAAAAGTTIRIGLDNNGGTANEVAATGGALTVSADGGDLTLNSDSAGSDVNLLAADGAGSSNAGGNIIMTPGGPSGAGTANAGYVQMNFTDPQGTAEPGYLWLNTDAEPATDQILRLDSSDAAANGGQVDFFVGDLATPEAVVTANQNGDWFFSEQGEAYIKETGGATSTGWARVQTETTTVTRGFFQDTFSSAVSAGSSITASDLTGSSLPAKPSANFTFDTDAMIFLNGLLLMNGTGNEVTDGTGDEIDIEAAGPSAAIGDVLTVIYHTNSDAL